MNPQQVPMREGAMEGQRDNAIDALRARVSWLARRVQGLEDDEGAPSAALAGELHRCEHELLERTRRRQLRQGGPWLFGAAPCIADFSVGHCLWFIRRAGPVAQLLDGYPAIGAWLDRLAGLRNADAFLSSSDPPAGSPDYFGSGFTDANGAYWQEINLQVLSQQPEFLSISA